MKRPLPQILSLGLLAALSSQVSPAETVNAPRSQAPTTIVEVPPRIDPKRCPAPEYPPVSRRNKEEGRVVLDLEVDAKGGVAAVRIVEPSKFVRLRSAAEKSASKWTLIPASSNGKSVAGILRVSFLFRLERKENEPSSKVPE